MSETVSPSPMIQQYLRIKEENKDCLLFFRVGDFYEMFFDDAELVSRELDLTLTGRNCGLKERAPMCGVPHHSVDIYIHRLVQKGYKVALCDQLTEPDGKVKLVERDVVKIVTAGTLTDNVLLDEAKNNYLASVFYAEGKIGISWCDLSTGEFLYNQFNSLSELSDALFRIKPVEIICNSEMLFLYADLPCIKAQAVPLFCVYHDWAYDYLNAENALKGILSEDIFKTNRFAVCAAGALLEYLKESQKREITNIQSFLNEDELKYMRLDFATRKHLELTEAQNDRKSNRSTLLWILDATNTPMGKRQLRKWIERPLYDINEINLRLEAVDELYNDSILRRDLIDKLKCIRDLERASSKIALGNVNPKDLIQIKETLSVVPEIMQMLRNTQARLLQGLHNGIDTFSEEYSLIDRAIADDDKDIKDGLIIKKGYSEELDELRAISLDGKALLTALEQKERTETNIKTLKVGYNRIFGYYIEVSKSFIDAVPYRYERKQTLANCERYITAELKDLEVKLLTGVEESLKLEQELYQSVCEQLNPSVRGLQALATRLAVLDCIISFSQKASENNYCRPELNENGDINITDGRHPVIEILQRDEIKLKGGFNVSIPKEKQFVPNNTLLDNNMNRIMVITGPNMAGKSTYMRQVALIVLLAHIGSFVPAKEAKIALTDGIYTRIGAGDDLSMGYSTFLMEMLEVSGIIKSATKNSLLILDEIGRGTSTYDGLSIAWSVMEYISKELFAKTLFSTHYHELTELEESLEGVKNYCFSVKELSDTVVFLRKIARGQARKSFGIEVAAMAGLPNSIILRSKEILRLLKDSDIVKSYKDAKATSAIQGTMFDRAPNLNAIASILADTDLNKTTPMQAFEILADLIERIKEQ